MKKTLLLMAFALVCALPFFTSCDKEEYAGDVFVGSYEMTIVTDSLSADGVWFSSEYYQQMTGKPNPDLHGVLKIEPKEEQGTYLATATITLSTGETQTYFVANAKYNEETENLELDRCSLANPYDYVYNFEFNPFKYQEPLSFRSEMHTFIGTLDCGYIYTIVGNKTK